LAVSGAGESAESFEFSLPLRSEFLLSFAVAVGAACLASAWRHFKAHRAERSTVVHVLSCTGAALFDLARNALV
jgi:hypothetical protein